MKIEITRLHHCENELCSMGELLIENCPLCNQSFCTCENWYTIEEQYELTFTCVKCHFKFKADYKKGEWECI